MKHTHEKLKLLSEAMREFGGVITLPVSLAVELKEYERVCALPWEDMVENLRCVILVGHTLGPALISCANACDDLLLRYKKGERTQELFDDMKRYNAAGEAVRQKEPI